ncbi:MAG: hypothetical protein KKB70_03210 [Proteobacteria bacterium]|nr:hypothetical protein [Pseudomonadota bacterium]MBU1610796.1 hypothetical protein [Pseudomonadota bacterium]
MIDRARAEILVSDRARKLPLGHSLRVESYKRDRFLQVGRKEIDTFQVVQYGFDRAEHVSDAAGLKKLLKALFKREFPRSTKLRLTAT